MCYTEPQAFSDCKGWVNESLVYMQVSRCLNGLNMAFFTLAGDTSCKCRF